MVIVEKGVKTALMDDSHLRRGLTFYYGELTLKETAGKLNLIYVDPLEEIAKQGLCLIQRNHAKLLK